MKLVRERDGQPIGGWPAIGRLFAHIIDSLPCYLGWFWPLWDPKRQTFTDKAMGTVTIRLKSPTSRLPPRSGRAGRGDHAGNRTRDGAVPGGGGGAVGAPRRGERCARCR